MNTDASKALEARIGEVVADFIDEDHGLKGQQIGQCIVCALSALLVRAWLAALTPNVPRADRPREVAKSIKGGPWEDVAELTLRSAEQDKGHPKVDA